MVSAANSNSESSSSASGARAPFSGTPVAHEASVIATGARTDESGKRELFKETTSTALVFPNGGVIRLSAAAAPGQLLFLTNPQTRREVVAQVTRRRSNPGAGYYIEVEFTEPAADFWGVAFPEAPARSAAAPSAPQAQSAEPVIAAVAPAAAEFLQPAEPGSADLGPNAPAPSADEVNALMEEVEALRAQLKSMQTQAANPGLPAMQLPASQPADPSAAASALPPNAPDLGAMLSSLVAPPAPQQDLPVAAAPSSAPPAASSPDHAPAPQQMPPAHEPDQLDALLPKPALDFAKSGVPHNSMSHASAAPPSDHTGLLRLALLAVVSLFAVMVAAWNMHLLPWLTPKASSPATLAAAQPANKTSRPAATPKANSPAAAMDNSAAANSPSLSAAPSQPAPSGDSASVSIAPSDSASNSSPAQPAPSTIHDSAAPPLTSVSKHSPVRDSKSVDPHFSAPSSNDSSITPPRLIKSVRAVAPGNALRQFMTGNVTLDALIDKTGQVKSMKVLSGPPSFHKAAMEALKHYRYEPARQNGKPVSAHLTVTIPFWFEP